MYGVATHNLESSTVNGYYHPLDPGEPGTGQKRLSVNDQEGRILATLVRDLTVLEIGTGLGISTRYLAMSASQVVTIDVDPWVSAHVFPLMPYNVICADKLYDWMPRQFDAAFLDGLHTRDQVIQDIGIMRARVKPGGLMIFHDLYIDDVRFALRECCVPYLHIQTRAGMAVAWNE